MLCFASGSSARASVEKASKESVNLESAYISSDIFHFIDPKVTTESVLEYSILGGQYVYSYKDRSQTSIDNFDTDFLKTLHSKQKWQCGIRVRSDSQTLDVKARNSELTHERGPTDHRFGIYLELFKKQPSAVRTSFIQVSFLYSDELGKRWCKVINIAVELDNPPLKMLSSLDPYLFLLGLIVLPRTVP